MSLADLSQRPSLRMQLHLHSCVDAQSWPRLQGGVAVRICSRSCIGSGCRAGGPPCSTRRRRWRGRLAASSWRGAPTRPPGTPSWRRSCSTCSTPGCRWTPPPSCVAQAPFAALPCSVGSVPVHSSRCPQISTDQAGTALLVEKYGWANWVLSYGGRPLHGRDCTDAAMANTACQWRLDMLLDGLGRLLGRPFFDLPFPVARRKLGHNPSGAGGALASRRGCWWSGRATSCWTMPCWATRRPLTRPAARCQVLVDSLRCHHGCPSCQEAACMTTGLHQASHDPMHRPQAVVPPQTC